MLKIYSGNPLTTEPEDIILSYTKRSSQLMYTRIFSLIELSTHGINYVPQYVIEADNIKTDLTIIGQC